MMKQKPSKTKGSRLLAVECQGEQEWGVLALKEGESGLLLKQNQIINTEAYNTYMCKCVL